MTFRTARFALFASSAGALAASLVAAGPATSAPLAAKAQTMTLYSVVTSEQFVNNSDDRQRGKGNNPFGNYKDLTATTKERGNGPFPGDEALFKFNVYSSPRVKGPIGTAVFTCQYNFNKNAFCDASYQLSGGTLIGAGPLNFNSPVFSIAITGGTGKYRSAQGQLQSTQTKANIQRITVNLR
jgi:hypothetical protein